MSLQETTAAHLGRWPAPLSPHLGAIPPPLAGASQTQAGSNSDSLEGVQKGRTRKQRLLGSWYPLSHLLQAVMSWTRYNSYKSSPSFSHGIKCLLSEEMTWLEPPTYCISFPSPPSSLHAIHLVCEQLFIIHHWHHARRLISSPLARQDYQQQGRI